MNQKELEKKVAGEKAVDFIKDGMIIGLGTGTTVYWMMKKLGERISQGLNVLGVPTSIQTEKLANEFGIPLIRFKNINHIDLAIDGADEVDPELNLIKGGGGSLVREKIVAQFAKQFIIIVDREKMTSYLGGHFLPVEVTPFGWEVTAKYIENLGCRAQLRKQESKIFVTDNDNYILDCFFNKIHDVQSLNADIKLLTGVVDSGLFINMTDFVIVGKGETTEIIKKGGN